MTWRARPSVWNGSSRTHNDYSTHNSRSSDRCPGCHVSSSHYSVFVPHLSSLYLIFTARCLSVVCSPVEPSPRIDSVFTSSPSFRIPCPIYPLTCLFPCHILLFTMHALLWVPSHRSQWITLWNITPFYAPSAQRFFCAARAPLALLLVQPHSSHEQQQSYYYHYSPIVLVVITIFPRGLSISPSRHWYSISMHHR